MKQGVLQVLRQLAADAALTLNPMQLHPQPFLRTSHAAAPHTALLAYHKSLSSHLAVCSSHRAAYSSAAAPVLFASGYRPWEVARKGHLLGPSQSPLYQQRACLNVSCRASDQQQPLKDSKMQDDQVENLGLLRTTSVQFEEAAQTAASWRERVAANVRESFLLTYTTLVESVLVTVADFLRLSAALNWLTPRLENGIGALTGSRRKLRNGETVAFSLVNNTAPDFSIPPSYSARDFPFVSGPSYHPAVAHMLSLCMKLVYEKPELIQDIAESTWGITYHTYLSTGVSATDKLYLDPSDKARFEPHTRTTVLETRHAIIVAFRGSEPTNLINFRSSGRIALLPQSGMGRVHAGFWACLFFGDPERGTLFSRVVEVLTHLPDTRKPIYLTGHSLGAALSFLFAQAAHVKHPELASRIAAVYTFAAPRVGDAEFVRSCEEAYPQRLHRLVHSSDIVPRVPPQFLSYEHCGQEKFITTFGRILSDPAEIKRWHRIEGFGFLPLYVYKLFAGVVVRGESVRSLYRLVLLFVLPGLADHWPSDYEQWIRKALENDQRSR